MPRIDRYILSQFLGLFGFFALVLVGVYWINKAVGLFDQLIGDGQSALVFLEFSLLTLPTVIKLVLPVAAFIATVYGTNRMMTESELVVMQATGFSAFRLARPVMYFGLVVAVMMLLMAHVLVPASRATLVSARADMSENITARFLNEGQFSHPSPDVTLYIREISPQGELLDMFLSDEREPAEHTTYTARKALFVRGDAGPKLIMFDGMAQVLDVTNQRLSVTRFADFTFDIGALLTASVRPNRTSGELSTAELLWPTPALVTETGETAEALRFDGHNRFAEPLLAVSVTLVGFASLLVGGFSRFGLWRQIVMAVCLLVVVQGLATSANALGDKSAQGWMLAYVAPVAGLLMAWGLLWWAGKPRHVAKIADKPAVKAGGGRMILNFYIARRFLWLFLRVFGGFFALMLMIDLIDELRKFSTPGLTIAEAFQLSLMNVPATLYRILPLILILSAIALFLGLARSSELVVVRSSGRSGLSFLMPPVLTAFVIGAFSVAVLDPLVAATSRRYDILSAGHARGGSVLSVSESGLWLRQGNDLGQTVIEAARANLDGTVLFQASFLTFAPDGTPQQRIEAGRASLIPGFWQLSNAKAWPLTSDNPERAVQTLPPGATIATDLTRDRIHDSFGTPSAISFWNLPTYIKDLERAGFSARSHQVWFQMELALPLLLAAMVLIAAGFTMRHARMAKTGTLVLFALLSGFAVFFLRNFGQVLGENGQIPVMMAAWTPPLAAAMLALGFLLHLEDG